MTLITCNICPTTIRDGERMPGTLDEIKRRCEEANFVFGEEEGDPETEEPATLYIGFPRGRTTEEVEIQDGSAAERLASEPFEGYRLVEEFEASWSSEQRIIECTLIDTLSQARLDAYSHWVQNRSYPENTVLGQLAEAVRNEGHQESQQTTFEMLADEAPLTVHEHYWHPPVEFSTGTDLSVSIGPCTNMHGILFSGAFGVSISSEDDIEASRFLTLQIRGADANTQSDVVELLQRVGDSLLFQIDIALDLSFMLKREYAFQRSHRWSKDSKTAGSLPPVRYEYDHEPMSLYWYGKTASAMPMLQFLAYYQVIEYYFPIYTEIEAQKTLRNILKDPTFNPMRDSDITKLLEAIKLGSKGRTIGRESDQLEATIRHCVTAEDLRAFLAGDAARYDFYTSDSAKKVVKATVPIRKESDDHRLAVTNRIYAIRNRIVHTKSGYEDQEPLFPFDPETKYLSHDIDLVEFLARKVLIASSRPLQI